MNNKAILQAKINQLILENQGLMKKIQKNTAEIKKLMAERDKDTYWTPEEILRREG